MFKLSYCRKYPYLVTTRFCCTLIKGFLPMPEDATKTISRIIVTAAITIGASFFTIAGNYVVTGAGAERELVKTVASLDAKVISLTKTVEMLVDATRSDKTPSVIAVVQVRLDAVQVVLDQHSRELEQLRSYVYPDSSRQVRK